MKQVAMSLCAICPDREQHSVEKIPKTSFHSDVKLSDETHIEKKCKNYYKYYTNAIKSHLIQASSEITMDRVRMEPPFGQHTGWLWTSFIQTNPFEFLLPWPQKIQVCLVRELEEDLLLLP
mmetsp:Transcript_10699/g.15756  ORF Transcript_10699/g.15756 Transcript_10699/m.15756 type:complete len:121 (-) Transcript_10699:320-682(-)